MARVISNAEMCPLCDKRLLPVRGKGDILIIGEFPGFIEINMHVPWVGDSGDVMKAELGRVGLSLDQVRSTHLWLHQVASGPEKKAELDFHFSRMLAQIETAKYVLLCGAELATLMFGHKISQINGLVYRELDKEAPIQWLKKGQVAVAAFNPATCLNPNGVVGDFRLAIQRFADAIQRGRKK
jgi:uracil-DNA glycosylase family 4